jgi:hypothetical protein
MQRGQPRGPVSPELLPLHGAERRGRRVDGLAVDGGARRWDGSPASASERRLRPE